MELKSKSTPIDLNKIHSLIKKIDESKVSKISPYYVYLNEKTVNDGFISNKKYCLKSAKHNNLNDAFNVYLRWLNHVSLVHGCMIEVELCNNNIETIIKEYIEPEKLPLEAIIVTYNRDVYKFTSTYFAYNIVEVREVRPGERYCHLHYKSNIKEYLPWDEVYYNFDSFLNCYENGIGILGNIVSGASIIDEFIDNYIHKKKINISY